MYNSDVQYKLLQYILSTTGRDVKIDTCLAEEQVLDSMGFIELVAYVESEFQVQFEAEELETAIVSVKTITEQVVRKAHNISCVEKKLRDNRQQ